MAQDVVALGHFFATSPCPKGWYQGLLGSAVRLLPDVRVHNLSLPHSIGLGGTMTRKPIREAVAAVGVILSLLFVGLELRQNTLAVRATALNDLATGSREWTLAIASNPALAAVMASWLAGDSLGRTERLMAVSTVIALLRNVENVFLQVEAGAVDESALVSYGFGGVGGPFASPHFAEYWETRKGNYDLNFVLAFDAERGLAN